MSSPTSATRIASAPDPEVPAKATRRRFTAAYKLRILERAERCGEGELGGLLRREGLYYSHLTAWRGQRERGALAGLEPKKRGPKPARKDPRDETIRQLAREVSRLEKKLEQAKTIIDVQKKVSRLLGITLDQPDEENS
jgi:transposase-like protein